MWKSSIPQTPRNEANLKSKEAAVEMQPIELVICQLLPDDRNTDWYQLHLSYSDTVKGPL